MHSRSPHDEALTDAERWHARLLAPDCTAAERLEFQRWRAAPEHAAAYAATERLWQSMGRLAGRPDLQRLSQRILADAARAAPPPRWGGRIAAAMVLITLMGAGVFLAALNRGPPLVVYATKPGERSVIRLADGSQLILNYSTELAVRLGRHARELTLRNGEALFAVAHDENRPFVVKAGDGEVRAIGTRFQVRHEAEGVTVTLLEGRVRVDRPSEKERVQLQPGDQVRFTEARPEITRGIVDPQVVSSWTVGRLIFRSTPLSEALREVNRYAVVQIRLADPAYADFLISGTFEVGDSASVVSALEALLPIQPTEEPGQIILQPKR